MPWCYLPACVDSVVYSVELHVFCDASEQAYGYVASLHAEDTEGSSSHLSAVLQHPVSDPVELGGDTTLQCSVLTDTSAGEHSVYWFRHGSGESHPGIIYTHGNRSDQCKSSSDSSTQSCVYKLLKRNLSLSDAGTYYCAVLMCGEIILGSGTKLDVVGKSALGPIILALTASNIISVVVVIFVCSKRSRHNDETTVIGLILEDDESAYRLMDEQVVLWSKYNSLELNTVKIVQMAVDIRRNPSTFPALTVLDRAVMAVESYKFLGMTITKDLEWD
ncbi:hypothetical protein NFI96_026945 [Prochilodus magdalenae]|nr:hypothetical protein NFI96_026945 [Prochilodus magdalenae]